MTATTWDRTPHRRGSNRLRALVPTVFAGVLGAGMLATALPAGATTTDRGATKILTCTDVSARLTIKDATKHGIDKTVRDVKGAGIKHEEGVTPNAGITTPTGKFVVNKFEPDINHTPDLGDTDSCSGMIASNFNSWNGHVNPYTPNQDIADGSINEIVKLAGVITGRATCDTSVVDPSEYALHGKLVYAFGKQAAVGSLNTPTALDSLGKKVQGQVYITTSSVPGYLDLITLNGIGIKGMGEGAWFDTQVSYRPPSINLGAAIESCVSGTDDDANGVIGEGKVGGLITVTTDTNADTGVFGDVLAPGPELTDRTNSFDWSI